MYQVDAFRVFFRCAQTKMSGKATRKSCHDVGSCAPTIVAGTLGCVLRLYRYEREYKIRLMFPSEFKRVLYSRLEVVFLLSRLARLEKQ